MKRFFEYLMGAANKALPAPSEDSPPVHAPTPTDLTLVKPRELSVVSASPPSPKSPRQSLEEKCFQFGYDIARRSGRVEVDESALRAIEGRAQAMAMSLFHPLGEDVQLRKIGRLKAAEDGLKRKALDRDRCGALRAGFQQQRGKLGPLKDWAEVSPFFRYAAIIALSRADRPDDT